MVDWYGIPGIEFHYRGNYSDPEITFDGVTDSVCVDVEDAMYQRYRTDESDEWLTLDELSDRGLAFDEYMLNCAEYVKELITLLRG